MCSFAILFIFVVSCVFGNYVGYNITFDKENGVYSGHLKCSGHCENEMGVLDFKLTLSSSPRLEITPAEDPSRWRIPPTYYSYDSKYSHNEVYEVRVISDPFLVTIKRSIDSFTLLEFSLEHYRDQDIEFRLNLGSTDEEKYIYGLGERTSPFRLKMGQDYTIFNKNYHVTYPGLNLYGSHPVFFQVNPTTGFVNGVFFLNSNAMNINLGTQEMTYRTIGGVIDLFVLPGINTRDVLQSYFSIIGRPRMIPSWALGFHNCKYGYNSTEVLQDVVANYSIAKIPLEAIWSDIDYMEGYKSFTVDPIRFKKLKTLIDEIHMGGQKYVLIVDPGIKVEEGYKSYDEGMEMDVFIKSPDSDDPFPGWMFCGEAYFPDFEHTNTSKYWKTQLEYLYNQVPFDAVWLDQDELTSFCQGFCGEFQDNRYDNPPYVPGLSPGNHRLYNLTLSLSSRQNFSRHYDTHNLYPFEETRDTITALEEIRQKRTFLVSRSSFAGSGQFGGHWLGDNNATWEDLKQSIPGLLNFNLFGIPLVGADVGGFYRDTPKELMIRWIQLGSFYPFMRDHAHKSVKHQELYSFDDEVKHVSRTMINRRYSLFPYMYTTFYQFHKYSFPPPAAALWSVLPFPEGDHGKFLEIDEQFMVGQCLLVSPVLSPMGEGQESALTIFLSPSQRWYQFGGMEVVEKGWVSILVPLDEISLHYRGGCAVPMHDPKYTIEKTMETSITFICAFDENDRCEGQIYADEGDNLDPTQYKYGTFTAFTTSNNNKQVSDEKMSPRNICLGKYTLIQLYTEQGSAAGAENQYHFKRKNLREIKLLGVSGSILAVHVFRDDNIVSIPVQRIQEVWTISEIDLDLFGDDWKIVLCREVQKKSGRKFILAIVFSVLGSVACTIMLLCGVCCVCMIGGIMFIVWAGSRKKELKYKIMGKDYMTVMDEEEEDEDDGNEEEGGEGEDSEFEESEEEEEDENLKSYESHKICNADNENQI